MDFIISATLLCTALILAWLSTRQFVWWVRSLILLLSAAALVFGGWLLWRPSGAGAAELANSLHLLQALVGAGDGPVYQALGKNWDTVEQIFPSLLPLFYGLGALIVVLAVSALTPGEAIERFTRPFITFLVGALGGGALVMVAVALGAGGNLKPRAYLILGAQAEVIDGDSFNVGDVSFRLDGMDAPEIDQFCLRGAGRVPCGVYAKAHLQELLIEFGQLVCAREDESPIPPEESFGRPLVVCTSVESGVNIGERMMADGHAVVYPPQNEQRFVSFHDGCSLHPRHWRRDARLRNNFENAVGLADAGCPL